MWLSGNCLLQEPPTVFTCCDVMLIKSDAGIWDWRKHFPFLFDAFDGFNYRSCLIMCEKMVTGPNLTILEGVEMETRLFAICRKDYIAPMKNH